MPNTKQRNSSIELVKVIAVFLIILSSALPYGASYAGGGYSEVYVNLNLTEFSFSHILYTIFRWCGQVGDDLFVACSAWFLCDSKRAKPNKVVKMIADSWVLSIIGLVIAFAFGIPSLKEIIKSIFPVTFELNWFVGCYIIYYLIHPLINRAVEGIERKQFRIIILIMFLAYSAAATISSETFYYSTPLVTFICLHLMVTYIKRYKLYEKVSDKQCVCGICICAFLIIVWIVAINFAGQYIDALQTRNLLFYRFCNPVIIILALCSLCIAVKKEFYSKSINAIGAHSLLIYLIHGNYFWLSYGKYAFYAWLYGSTILQTMPFVLTVLCVAALYILIVPILAILVERTIGKLTSKVSQVICSKGSLVWNKI